MYKIKCMQCGEQMNKEIVSGTCPYCGKLINFIYSNDWHIDKKERSMWRYGALLPIEDSQNIISLGEGYTPLLRSNLSQKINVSIKDESRNPTGSMKDRAMAVAYSKAKELNLDRSIMMSAGGAGISASAYASKSGIENVILIPTGVSPMRKMTMQIYGSTLIEVQGNIEDCLQIIEDVVTKHGWYHTSTYKRANPYTLEGAKTIAYELYEQSDSLPEYIFIPIGGGGTLVGIWKGLKELKDLGKINTIPKLIGVQNKKFNALEIALDKNYYNDQQLKDIDIDSTVDTVTAAIRHSYVPDGEEALQALRDTHGRVVVVTDEEAMQAQKEIAENDGLFFEPSSSTSLAAFRKMENEIPPNSNVCLLLTGSGYREIDTTVKYHFQEELKLTVKESYDFFNSKS